MMPCFNTFGIFLKWQIRLLSHYFNGFGVVQRSLAIVDSMMRGFAFVTFGI